MNQDFRGRETAHINTDSQGHNNDTLLLAALIYLLMKDGADRYLIMALIYVMF